jgi:hypothetical protein
MPQPPLGMQAQRFLTCDSPPGKDEARDTRPFTLVNYFGPNKRILPPRHRFPLSDVSGLGLLKSYVLILSRNRMKGIPIQMYQRWVNETPVH